MAAEAEPTRPSFPNPLLLWADRGLRALESSVATSQKIGDTVDRMTRAGAAPVAEDMREPAAGPGLATGAASLAPVSPVALMTQMHRTTFDTMQQGWLHWMSMVGTLATATVQRGLPAAVPGQEHAAASIAAIESPVDASSLLTQSPASARKAAANGQQESHANSRREEHAHAAAEAPKRRRRAVAKRKPASRDS